MSKIFMTVMNTVTKTVTTVPQICGTMILKKAWLLVARGVGIDEPPDGGRPDHRDRHRQEDERLRDLLRARTHPVGEHGDEEPDDDGHRRDDRQPEDRVEDGL